MSYLSRREFLGTSATALTGAVLAQDMVEEKSLNIQCTGKLICPPVTRGHLRFYDHAFAMKEGIEGWRRELNDERRIGSNLLWLSHVRPALDETKQDTLKEVLDACAERNMGVIIETGHTPNWYGHCDLERELDEVRTVCASLAERYGEHPAFHAWYLHHEIYVARDAFGKYIDELYPAAVEVCKKVLPDKPV